MSQTKAQLIDPVDGSLVNADINASAAIAGTKISPDFGSQGITTTGVISMGNGLTLTGTNPFIDIVDSNNNDDFTVKNDNGKFKIQDKTNSVDRLSIDSDGDVGIGTDSPDQLIHINKTSGTTLFKASVAGNSTIGLEIQKTGSTTQSWRIVDGQTVNGKLEFYDVTDSATRMCIDGSGNVGIGTTSPSSLGSGFKELIIGGDTEGAGIELKDDNANVRGGLFTSDSTNAMIVRTITNHPMMFRTNNTIAMTIDSSQRLGIGLTPSSGQGVLQLNGGLRVAGSASASDTSGPYIYRTSGADHLNIATSGLERMKVTSGGHLQLISGNLEFASGSGIDFSNISDGSRSVSTDGNKFDDYEEGSFSFTKRGFAGGFDANYALANQTGKYTKIGRLVTLKGGFSLSGNSGNIAATDYFTVYMSSLPFAMDDTSSGASGAIISHQGAWWAYTSLGGGNNAKGAVIAVYNDYLSFYTTSVTGSTSRNNNEITFTITYTSS